MAFFKKKMKKNQLLDILPSVRGEYLPDEPLNRYTWFGVGGPAEIMYCPKDSEDLCHFMKNKPYNLPVFVIGGGSNLLVRDGGIPGVVIRLKNKFFKKWKLDSDKITCGAGMKNSELKKIMTDNNRPPLFKSSKDTYGAAQKYVELLKEKTDGAISALAVEIVPFYIKTILYLHLAWIYNLLKLLIFFKKKYTIILDITI